MQLIMENWRKFIAETERTKNYGDLYLFENGSVQKVSFYDRLNALNESDDDFKIFLEQWEKSVDYVLNGLLEQEEEYTASLKAGTQAFMLLQRGAASTSQVMSFAKKLKDKGNLGKVGGIMLTGLVAAATLIGIKAIMDAGADVGEITQQVSALADTAAAIDPDVGQALEQVAQKPDSAIEVLPKLDQAVEQTAQQLSQVDSEAAQQVAQEAEKVSQQIDPMDEFAEKFEKALMSDPEVWTAEHSPSGDYQSAIEYLQAVHAQKPEGFEGELSKKDIRALINALGESPGTVSDSPLGNYTMDGYKEWLDLDDRESKIFRRIMNRQETADNMKDIIKKIAQDPGGDIKDKLQTFIKGVTQKPEIIQQEDPMDAFARIYGDELAKEAGQTK
jgi:hypothetical protein